MTKKEIYIVACSDLHHTHSSMTVLGVATKYSDAQKLYSKALLEDSGDVIHIFESSTGNLAKENLITESKKLVSSDGN